MVVAAGDGPDVGTIETLWAFHNSVFTVSYTFLAIALVGLSRAGVAVGLTPKAFAVAAPVDAGHADPGLDIELDFRARGP